MSAEAIQSDTPSDRPRLRKDERRERILLELTLGTHVRIADLARRFGVSTETVRRDLDSLHEDGLISRAHGGASVAPFGQYPGFDERNQAQRAAREAIGRRAADLVKPGETIMIDSGSTTLQLARHLVLKGTPCTAITNSLPVALALGKSEAAEVILCPGELMASESAVVGTDTVEFLIRHWVDRCMIGATGLSAAGPTETVRGFAAIKRVMLGRSSTTHLLIASEKFDRNGLVHVGGMDMIDSVVSDLAPPVELLGALDQAGTEVVVAEQS